MLLTGSWSTAHQERGVLGSIVRSALDYFTLEVILSPSQFCGEIYSIFLCSGVKDSIKRRWGWKVIRRTWEKKGTGRKWKQRAGKGGRARALGQAGAERAPASLPLRELGPAHLSTCPGLLWAPALRWLHTGCLRHPLPEREWAGGAGKRRNLRPGVLGLGSWWAPTCASCCCSPFWAPITLTS